MKKSFIIPVASFILLIIFTLGSISFLMKEWPITIPLKKYFWKPAIESNLSDSVKVKQLNKAAFALRLTDPSKTLELAESSLNLSKKINYAPGIAEAHRVKGIGYYYLNNTELAVKNYIEALKYFKQIKDIKNEARVYNNIGNLYKEINYEKALFYYNKALYLSKDLRDDELNAGLYFSISNIYTLKKDFNKSLKYLEISNQIFQNRKDTTYMIMYLQNSGMVYYHLNDYQTAKKRLFKAIEKAKKYYLYKVLIGSNLTLVTIFFKEKNYSAAEKSIEEGIKYSVVLGDTTLKNYFLYKAFENESLQKNYQKALKYLTLVYKHDSLLLSQNQSDNIGKTSSHYLQQQKIQENELTIAKQKYRETLYWWVITIIISILLLTAVIGLCIYFFLQKKRKKEELQIRNTITVLEQKALQAMMNPHFVFNVMNSIQYFISREESQEANQILSGFARLMRKHLEICLNSSITLHEEINYLRLYLSLEKIRFSEKMDYTITADPEMDADDIFIPSMLIQPFIENAIWHGIMPKDGGGLIKLDFRCNNNELRISIMDNGIGISNSKKTKTTGHISRGLELIHERVNLLNKLHKRNIYISQVQTGDSGTEVLITIPV